MKTCCIAQGTLLAGLWWPKWEEEPKQVIHVYKWLIPFAEEQRLVQQCKATVIQKKKKKVVYLSNEVLFSCEKEWSSDSS